MLPNPDVSPAALPDRTLPGSRAGTERYMRESARRVPTAALGAALGVLGLAAAGGIWGFLRLARGEAGDRNLQSESAGPQADRKGPLAASDASKGPSNGEGAAQNFAVPESTAPEDSASQAEQDRTTRLMPADSGVASRNSIPETPPPWS